MKIASDLPHGLLQIFPKLETGVQRDRDWLAEAQSKLLRLQNFAYRREVISEAGLFVARFQRKTVRVCGSQIRTWVHSQLSGRGINPAAWPSISPISPRGV